MGWTGVLVVLLVLLVLLIIVVAMLLRRTRMEPPFAGNIERETRANGDYRRVVYTDPNQQLVYMSLAPGQEIGAEVHQHTTQFIRVEEGEGFADVNGRRYALSDGVAVVVPPGTRHNVVNRSERFPLKLYTIYSPPEHAPGLRQRTRQ